VVVLDFGEFLDAFKFLDFSEVFDAGGDSAEDDEEEEGVKDVDVVEHQEDTNARNVVGLRKVVQYGIVDDQSTESTEGGNDVLRLAKDVDVVSRKHYSQDEDDGEHDGHVGV